MPAGRRRSITYLVSGAPDIRPATAILQRSGRRVRSDAQVDADARRALLPNRYFVVVAHGNATGNEVLWGNSSVGTSSRWLWERMADPPRGARIYLYCCRAGLRVARFLGHCEAFGHKGDVPMPVAESASSVLDYLRQVDDLVGDPDSVVGEWREALAKYVNDALFEASETPGEGDLMRVTVLLQLRRSLGGLDV